MRRHGLFLWLAFATLSTAGFAVEKIVPITGMDILCGGKWVKPCSPPQQLDSANTCTCVCPSFTEMDRNGNCQPKAGATNCAEGMEYVAAFNGCMPSCNTWQERNEYGNCRDTACPIAGQVRDRNNGGECIDNPCKPGESWNSGSQQCYPSEQVCANNSAHGSAESFVCTDGRQCTHTPEGLPICVGSDKLGNNWAYLYCPRTENGLEQSYGTFNANTQDACCLPAQVGDVVSTTQRQFVVCNKGQTPCACYGKNSSPDPNGPVGANEMVCCKAREGWGISTYTQCSRYYPAGKIGPTPPTNVSQDAQLKFCNDWEAQQQQGTPIESPVPVSIQMSAAPAVSSPPVIAPVMNSAVVSAPPITAPAMTSSQVSLSVAPLMPSVVTAPAPMMGPSLMQPAATAPVQMVAPSPFYNLMMMTPAN